MRLRQTRIGAFLLVLALAAPLSAGEVAKADLDILGLGLEVDRNPVTTAVDVPAYVQTLFGGKTGDDAPPAPGLSALGELTGPGITTPITLATTPGRLFALPALHEKGEYALQNIRLVGSSGEFLQQAVPSFAIINVTDVLKTEVRVRQLSPDELRQRGIIIDSRNYDVYEYTFVFGVDQSTVEIPYPVIIDKRTHEVVPVPRESPYSIPPIPQNQKPPRFAPPSVEPFELGPGGPPEGDGPPDGEQRSERPSIPAALVVPTGFGVLHQFFAVILQVDNGAPEGSNIRLDSVTATINAPTQLRVAKVIPAVSIGQPVPITDEKTGATFLVAGGRGNAEWTLEALKAGTHTVNVEVNATYQKPGQADFPLRGRVSTSLVVSDPRFQINFSHPDTVRKDEKYTAYAFVTNLSPQQQTVSLDLSYIPLCTSGASADNICRDEGTPATKELTIPPGGMVPVPYKLNSKISGKVFAAAGVANDEGIVATVKLTMGVSTSGIPLSPATLVMPYYARFLPSEFVDANMQLLGLGYSLSTAPLNAQTAAFPRVIKTDVFTRAQQIARAGQRIFIARRNRDASDPLENREPFFHLALDLLGNTERMDQSNTTPEMREWDDLRQAEQAGRRAGAAMARQLEIQAFSAGETPRQFVDEFAAATSHRTGYLFAYAHGAPVSGVARPYAISIDSLSGSLKLAEVAETCRSPHEPVTEVPLCVRSFPYSELTQLNAGGDHGELALIGQWRQGDIRVKVLPATDKFTLHLIYPEADGSALLRTDIDVINATAGRAVEIVVRRGQKTLIVDNATATPIVDTIPQTALRVIGAAQDLHLDEHGHLVSMLFNRPVKVADAAALRDRFALTMNVPKASYTVTRKNNPSDPNAHLQIPGAALQDDAKIVNISFDKTLSRNAEYKIAVESILDLTTAAAPPFAKNDIVPRIDNDRPGAILTGRVLRGDNSVVPNVLVRLLSNGTTQIDPTGTDGRFLYEFVPRDIDSGLFGNYELSAIAEGKQAKLEGAVRLPGEVHTVNLQFLGRGVARGQVRYHDGEVIPDVTVTIGSTMFDQARRGTTDASGNYEIGDLPVGPLTFSVNDKDGRPTYAANQIRVAGEVVTQDLVIVKREAPGLGNVRVTVRRSDTNAIVSGALVGVWAQGYALRDGYTSTDGSLTFNDIPAGIVSVLAADFSISRNGAGVEVELRADQTLEQTLVLSIPQPNVKYATLTGIVKRDDPAAPGDTTKDQIAPGAIVTIDRMPAVTADADGRYTFTDLTLDVADRRFTVFDPATGRRGYFSVPTLVEGSNEFNPRLRSTQPAGIATMRVRVYGSQGEPVTGYRVIWPGYPPTTFASKGNGVYELPDMRVPQQIDVVAVPPSSAGHAVYGQQVASGYVRVDFHGQIGVTDLRLPGSGTVVVRVEVEQSCSTPPCGYAPAIGPVALSYAVWDEAEQGMRGVTIEGTPDPNTGLVTFTKVPARQNLNVATARNPLGYAAAGAYLSYDGDVRNVTLRLKTIGDVTGRVYAHDGVTPISGATVRIYSNRATYPPAITNPDGTFRFAGFPAGTAFHIVADLDRDGVYRTGIVGGQSPAGGGPVSNLIIVMRTQSTVEGQVLDSVSGEKVPLARYWLRELAWPYRSIGTPQDPLFADINGRFIVSNVFTGEFRITAVSPDNQEIRGDYQGALLEEGDARQRSIQVRIGGAGSGAVSVTVVDPLLGFTKVANAEVALLRGSQRFDFTSTNDNGVAFFDSVPVGRYTVVAYSKAAGRAGHAVAFDVFNGNTTPVSVQLEFRGYVSGTLTDPESEPTPGLPVKGMPVQMQATGISAADSTDIDGFFEFNGVPEGYFYLSAFEIGTHRRAVGPTNLYIDRLVPERTGIKLELERTATLTVKVFLPNDTGGAGELAPLVEVTVWQGDLIYGPVPYYRGQQGNPVVFRKMLAGMGYGIEVRELGGEQRVVRTGGGFGGALTKEHHVTLPTSGTVEVSVVDAAGVAVQDAKVTINSSGLGTRTMYTPASGRVTLPGVPFGWVSASATKGNVSASGGGSLASRSHTLVIPLNLGSNATVEGGVDAEIGDGSPSVATRVLLNVTTSLSPAIRLETLTDSAGNYRFTGIPIGNTTLTLTFYGPDDTTVGATRTVPVANGTTGTITIPRVRIDATPPRVLSIDPPANATSVSPSTAITITFSEQIASGYLNSGWFQLIATDDSSFVNCAFEPSVRPDGRFIVRLIPPAPPAGQKFPLKSNVIYRINLPQGIRDTTGNSMTSPVGSSFTTVNYTEPAIVKIEPLEKDPIPASTTFRIKFNKFISATSFDPGVGGVVLLERLDAFKGTAVETIPIAKFLDPADASTLIVSPQGVAIAESSFYRLTVGGARDTQTPPNVQKDPPRVFEFFSFDTKKPVATITSSETTLVSALLYSATVTVTDEGTTNESNDVAYVDWLDANGTAIARSSTKPFSYSFAAPATSTATTFTLKAVATDLSGNSSPEPDVHTWNVAPNEAPREIVVTNTPASSYPTHWVQTRVSFKDEGVSVTVALELRGTYTDGSPLTKVLGSKNVTRASVNATFADAVFDYVLPEELKDGVAKIVANVTDSVNKVGTAEAPLTILADTTAPQLVSFLPAAESRYRYSTASVVTYTIEVKAKDAETGISRAAISVGGVEQSGVTSTFDGSTGITTWRKTIPVPPRNADTRIAIVTSVYDKRNNVTTDTHEVIYERVDDATLPTAAWITPLDGAALPSNISGWQATLRVKANDDVKVTSVRFESTALSAPLNASLKAGTTDVYEAKATLNFPADKLPFVIKAIITDADPLHDVELPITVDPVETDRAISGDINISSITADQYANKSVVVRGARVYISVPLAMKDLILVDGALLSNPEETKLDLTIADRLFVDADSRIDLSGKGYLGAGRTAEGNTFTNSSRTGRTLGGTTTGGAVVGDASYGGIGGSYIGSTNATYGSITDPVDLGSGGGALPANNYAGNGGGAVILRGGGGLARFVIAGSVRADGDPVWPGGAGGSVNLRSRVLILSPFVRITANGSDDGPSGLHDLGGGGGRIAIRASDRLDLDTAAPIIQARGGRNQWNNFAEGAHYVDGGAGTIFLSRPDSTLGTLIVSAFDERFPNTTHRTAATPLGGSLAFDAITIGPRALARFDTDGVTPTSVHATAMVLTPADVPTVSITSTTPAAGGTTAQNTTITARFNAASTAGLRNVRTILSVQPNDVVTFPQWAETLSDNATTIAVPSSATPGTTTLKILVTDRAGRVAESAPVSLTIINNAPVVIQSFDVTPATETYPNRSISVSATASDDIAVQSISLTSSTGSVSSGTATRPTPTTMARSFTVSIPATTPGDTNVVLTLSAVDDVPGRVATTATHTVKILKDQIAPSVTVTKPTPNQEILEGTGATFDVEANVTDAEVAVKSVTATFEGTTKTMSFVSGTLYRANFAVPSVDGSESIAKTITVNALDYENNLATRDVPVLIKPLIDPNAPALSWVCGSPGAMFPLGSAFTLQLSAVPSSGSNGVSSVIATIDGAPSPITATRVGSTNTYQFTYTIPAGTADGTVLNVRVVVRSVGGNESTLLGTVTAVAGFIDIGTQSNVIPLDPDYQNRHVVVRSGGILVLNGEQHFRNLVVLSGGKVIQKHPDLSQASAISVDRLFVACGATIDVSQLGYSNNLVPPGAGWADDWSGGSHIGRGATVIRQSGGSFGSVYRPAEMGGAGETSAGMTMYPGGGAVRISATGPIAMDGTILATGGNRPLSESGPAGGGGSVWLSTPSTLTGVGTIDVRGGTVNYHGAGGGGAIALESSTATGTLFSNLRAYGGSASASGRPAAAGSIYRRTAASTFGDLTIANNQNLYSATELSSFGRHVAGSAIGSTITLDRAEWLAPSFGGHWVRVIAPDGTTRGTWRVAAITNHASARTWTGFFDIKLQDAVAYDGYVVYSDAGLGPEKRRWAGARFSGGVWQYDNDTAFVTFTPAAGDAVVASFSKDATRITDLRKLTCCSTINGMPVLEMVTGEFLANQIAGANGDGWSDPSEMFLLSDARSRGVVLSGGAPSITFEGTPDIQAGDVLQGVYRFDNVSLTSARVVTDDLVEIGQLTKDASSSLTSGNVAPPALAATSLSFAKGLEGPMLVAGAGSTSDADGVDAVGRLTSAVQVPLAVERAYCVTFEWNAGLSIRRVVNGRTTADYLYGDNCGASLTRTIGANGAVSFSASQANKDIQAALVADDTTRLYSEPNHNSFRLRSNGAYEIWANAVNANKNGTYTVATVFRIEKTATSIRWFVDGVRVHESTTNVPATARFDIAFGGDSGELRAIEYQTTSLDLPTFRAAAAADGSFRVPLRALPGDAIAVKARDRHRNILESAEVAAGTVPADFTIASVAFASSEVTGGRTVTGTVTLPSPAGADGARIDLVSGSSTVSVPSTFTIAAGQTSGTFVATSAPVTAPVDVTVVATWGAVSQSAVLRVVRDNVPPTVTVTAPASGTQYTEGQSAKITVTATVTDADSGVKRVFASFDGKSYDLARDVPKGADVYTAQIPVPFVDATTTKDLAVSAEDNSVNIGNATAVPLVINANTDANPPTVTWSCFSSGVMYAAGATVNLKVTAKPPNANNLLQKVEFIVTDPAGASTTYLASPLANDEYQYTFTIPIAADGAVYTVRAVATAASGTTAELTRSFGVIAGAVVISSSTSIPANDTTTYDNKSVIVTGGTVTIAGAHKFKRLIVHGGNVVHSAGGANRVDIEADVLYVGCGASINGDSLGYPQQQTHSSAVPANGSKGGSHIGRGANGDTGASYGSVYTPLEAGGGGYGGPGGGVIRIKGANVLVDGAVRANGGAQGGAGGSVYVDAQRIAGSGSIEARGADAGGYASYAGGGGMIAIHYTDASSAVPTTNVRGGDGEGCCSGIYMEGATGAVYIKRPASTYGDLQIANHDTQSRPDVELPSLGKGVAAGGSSGPTLITSRSTDIPAYFVGHWVEITNAAGTLEGTYRISGVNAKTATLAANGSDAPSVDSGDTWQGVYRFDNVSLSTVSLITSGDPIRAGQQTITGNVNATEISATNLTVQGTLRPHSSLSFVRAKVTNEVRVETGGAIDVIGYGWPAQMAPSEVVPANGAKGGSRIGRGANAGDNATYGSVYFPQNSGAGGYAGAGGGIVHLEAASVVVNGALRATGAPSGGAGGSIWVKAQRVSGTGTIDAHGADAGGYASYAGGGGAVAIEYTEATTLPALRSFGGNGGGCCSGIYLPGGPGAVYTKGPSSTYGDLTVISHDTLNRPVTDLPSLGRGVAVGGTSGTTLVTDRTVDVPAYFIHHWVEIRTAAGTVKGIWRITGVSGKSVTVVPNANESVSIQAGDSWRGVYRFDTIKLRNNVRLQSYDAIRYTTLDKDASSTLTANDAAPFFAAGKLAQIVVEGSADKDYVSGPEGAVLADPDLPVRITAKNVRTATEYTGNANTDGSFKVQVAGVAGDIFTVRATDSHALPLSSQTFSVNGSISERNSIASLALSSSTVAGGTSIIATLTLTAPAREGGSLIALSSSNAAAIVPATIIIPAGVWSQQFTITTTSPASHVAAVITATSANSVTATLNVAPASAVLTNLTLSSATVEGGAGVDATVTLGAAAPAGGAIVTLVSNTPNVRVPGSVTIPAGSTSVTFGVATSRVGATSAGNTITAIYGATKSASLTLSACTAAMEVAARPSSVALNTTWIDDIAPSGASGPATFDATQAASGSLALHFVGGSGTRAWSFSGAAALNIAPADNLVLHALVNPCNPPRQILVTWSDGGTQWRASWGEGRITPAAATVRLGALPSSGAWTRLEVPARTLGITSARSITGLTISVDGGEAWFDAIGNASCVLPAVAKPSYLSNEVVWFDDAVPPGAVPFDPGADFRWSSTQAASGTVSQHFDVSGEVNQSFFNATQAFPVGMNDVFFAYVLIDPCNPPRAIELQFHDGTGWWRRGYWGENLFPYGNPGTTERRRMGPMPEAGKWVRLEIPASSMQMAGMQLRGVSIIVHGGQSWFDRFGKAERVNVALNKPAVMSSWLGVGDIRYPAPPDPCTYNCPSYAVDGNVDTWPHTGNQYREWWQVDLGTVQPIEAVDIWNGNGGFSGCCYSRLTGFFLLVSDDPLPNDLNAAIAQPGVGSYYYQGTALRPSTFEVRRTGRYVRLWKEGSDFVHPGEVQVWAPLTVQKTNLSAGGISTQSTMYDYRYPELANNANTNGWWGYEYSINHTHGNPEEWWQVDLGAVKPIASLDLWGRLDYTPHFPQNFYVFVSDTPFTTTTVAQTLAAPNVSAYYYGTPATSSVIPVPIGRNGRYVRLQYTSNSQYAINFADVWVWSVAPTLGTLDAPLPAATTNTAPVFPTALRSQIVVTANASGDFVTGPAGAVTDPDTPIRVTATNTRTGQRSTANAAANGSFSVPVTGLAGDTFTLRAEDSHPHSLISTPVAVNGALAQASSIATVTIAPSTVDAGSTAMGTVRLDSPTATSINVALSSSSASAAVPATLTIPAGYSSAQFPITTASVPALENATITATYRGSRSGSFSIAPASGVLASLTLSASTVEGGTSLNGTVTLGAPAPAGGALVTLFSDNDLAGVQSSILVPEGATQAVFTVTTQRVGWTVRANISAIYGATKTAAVDLTACAAMTFASAPATVSLDTVWFDDDKPTNATVGDNSAVFDGTQVAAGEKSLHFTASTSARGWTVSAGQTLTIAPSDNFVFYALVNPCNPPRQVMVSFGDAAATYRPTWGENVIDNSIAQNRRGSMFPGGQWTRVEIPAKALGITANTTITWISIWVQGGELWLDRFGASSCSIAKAAMPQYGANEVVWFDDGLPAGAVQDAPTSTRSSFSWDSTQVASGTQSHVERAQSGLHEHEFRSATEKMTLAPGDVLFTYVFLDPCNPPREVMLSYQDASGSWEHRAYWGESMIQRGTEITASRWRRGALPELGKWVRLEVPVSSLGLENATITGAGFAVYDGAAWFDRAGKVSRVNVAFGKTARQSTTSSPSEGAQNAVNGNLADHTLTSSQSQPWWEVDLGTVQSIDTIEIRNRTDCCANLLAHFWIFLSDEPFASNDVNTIRTQPGVAALRHIYIANPLVVAHVARTARYVRIQLEGTNNLNLAEVQVWAPVITKQVNLAIGKDASQSTDYFSGYGFHMRAHGATDGVFDSHFGRTYTNGDAQGWWQTDLGASMPIASIDIWNGNANESSIERLTNFYLFVSDSPFASTSLSATIAQPGVSVYYYGTPPASGYAFPIGKSGRYIRIQLTTTNWLTLYEVQVWAQQSSIKPLCLPESLE